VSVLVLVRSKTSFWFPYSLLFNQKKNDFAFCTTSPALLGRGGVVTFSRTVCFNVGNRYFLAGFTRKVTEIFLDKNIKLLDCPGVVFDSDSSKNQSTAEVTLRNAVAVEKVPDPIAVGKLEFCCY
jgi:hypothetical protein